MEARATYAGRLRRFKAFIEKIPAQAFDLDNSGSHKTLDEFDLIQKNGFSCGAVACIAGWGISSPEYIAWCKRQRRDRRLWYSLGTFLGTRKLWFNYDTETDRAVVCRAADGTTLFGGSSTPATGSSTRYEALARLRACIQYYTKSK